ncbi:Uncharacterised protein [Acinetobacter baumannii]|nr:Uncharacterised protein [Acinetobacter baumannii]
MVMIWPLELWLRWLIIEANEVDLPVPVAPTKIIMPRLVIDKSLSTVGNCKSSIEGIFVSIRRSTIPGMSRC